ncbi:DNA replication/repair protein RecF [Paraglaciecola sp.]|uniref:DNA replication/repair protein RecF n=1 Tax=Paraglaciecola sp. TaxID=1920173 RepID=UPI0027402999|nr:DNA replication/repair protein RecF [Paraglaciecola sp.]MDP5031180.1 DNA replication/repair protein RecF [Paraglaciecola sp.]
MKLDLVQVNSFRNINELSIVPAEKLNVFFGANGSGKSSVLEAIHYLGFARSFRTNTHKNVIQQGSEGFTVFGIVSAKESIYKLGLSRKLDNSCTVSIDGAKTKSAVELVSLLPVQIFTPQSSELIIGSPKLRRKYLDWVLFHVEPGFAKEFAIYRRCLLQLNAILKDKRYSESLNTEQDYWIEQLCLVGERLSSLRTELMSGEFLSFIQYNLREFLPEFIFDFSYYKGWEKDLSLKESIYKNRERDKRTGFVSSGFHKADIRIKINSVAANEVLSRGQLRMLVAAMQIAQAQYLFSKNEKSVVFLLDDVGAELDTDKQQLFINSLINTGSQLFVTAIDKNQLGYLAQYRDKKLFHVEHGQVIEEI